MGPATVYSLKRKLWALRKKKKKTDIPHFLFPHSCTFIPAKGENADMSPKWTWASRNGWSTY